MQPRHKSKSDDRQIATALAVVQLPLPSPFSQTEGDGTSDAHSRFPVVVYSIGHSNHDAETFLALLNQHEVRTVIDVRSAPFSRYVPHFNRRNLARLVERAAMHYVWLGNLLGGRPEDPECYGADGALDAAYVASRPWHQDGIARVLASAAANPTVILCSEENPRRCHRHRLLEPSLGKLGAIVLHIRHDGTLEKLSPASEHVALAEQLVLAGIAQ
ncbi:MAG: DUF488 domain-containing protein [Thermomicrobiales bacterium]